KDGQVFEFLANADGAGTSIEVQNYTSKDRAPFTGVSYYRLKQTDFDGKWSYSNMVSVSLESSFGNISIIPNPVKGKSIVSFETSKRKNIEVLIKDLAGKTISAKNHFPSEGQNIVNLETEKLSNGMYLLILNNGEETSTVKFIVE
ncbi:MAG: T9SS type A sorting domain-containing protein, partial [Crocinitomicaceae bacterium]